MVGNGDPNVPQGREPEGTAPGSAAPARQGQGDPNQGADAGVVGTEVVVKARVKPAVVVLAVLVLLVAAAIITALLQRNGPEDPGALEPTGATASPTPSDQGEGSDPPDLTETPTQTADESPIWTPTSPPTEPTKTPLPTVLLEWDSVPRRQGGRAYEPRQWVRAVVVDLSPGEAFDRLRAAGGRIAWKADGDRSVSYVVTASGSVEPMTGEELAAEGLDERVALEWNEAPPGLPWQESLEEWLDQDEIAAAGRWHFVLPRRVLEALGEEAHGVLGASNDSSPTLALRLSREGIEVIPK